MIGRFAGSFLMKYISPSRLLSLFAGVAFLCAVLAMAATGHDPGLGPRHDWLLPLDHVPHHLRARHQGPRPYTKLGVLALGHGDHRRRRLSRAMGYVSDLTSIRDSLLRAAAMLPVYLVFCR